MRKSIFAKVLSFLSLCLFLSCQDKSSVKVDEYQEAERELFGYSFAIIGGSKSMLIEGKEIQVYDSIMKYLAVMEKIKPNEVYHQILRDKVNIIVGDYDEVISGYKNTNSFGIELFTGIAQEKKGAIEAAKLHFERSLKLANQDRFKSLIANLYLNGDMDRFITDFENDVQLMQKTASPGNFVQEGFTKESVTQTLLKDINHYIVD